MLGARAAYASQNIGCFRDSFSSMCGSVLQCVAVCCRMLQCAVVCCSVLQCVAVCCSVLPYVAVCCSVLQCVAHLMHYTKVLMGIFKYQYVYTLQMELTRMILIGLWHIMRVTA